MSKLKQQFKELLKEVKNTTRDSYTDIAYKTNIKLEVLKNAGSPSGRSFSVTQSDYDILKKTYKSLHSPSQPTDNLSTTDISKDIKDIKEMVQGIVKAKYDVVEPAIKEVARKYNTSEAKVIEALEVILSREIEEQRKKKE